MKGSDVKTSENGNAFQLVGLKKIEKEELEPDDDYVGRAVSSETFGTFGQANRNSISVDLISPDLTYSFEQKLIPAFSMLSELQSPPSRPLKAKSEKTEEDK